MLRDDDLRKFGFESGLLRLKGTTITRWKDGIDIDYPVREVEQFARAVERAAYERAAQQCEIVRHGMERHQEYAEACMDCAHEIRSLIPKEPA